MKTKTLPRKLKSKILPADRLKRRLDKIRKRNRAFKLVFTNGCFDLLHRGHVTYLELARSKGNCLVVALNSDGSVKKLKGPSRPLNPLADRLEVMAALECVDYVTWFEEETPLDLIYQLRPSVLTKGGDWKPEQIVGSKAVLGWGGKVLSLRYIKGQSTTRMIGRAKKSAG